MPRPKIKRNIRFNPEVYYYKPRGVPMRILEEVVLEKDEVEALKLHDVDGLNQMDSSKKMKVSQPTFARILNKAYKKVAEGIINGKAIRITDGS